MSASYEKDDGGQSSELEKKWAANYGLNCDRGIYGGIETINRG